MAEAGFFYCGSKNDFDATACFCCGKVLNGWESTDIPINEHRRHAPQCLFVKTGKPERELTVTSFSKFKFISLNQRPSADWRVFENLPINYNQQNDEENPEYQNRHRKDLPKEPEWILEEILAQLE